MKNNILIAEFMDFKKDSDGLYLIDDYSLRADNEFQATYINEMKYSSSWDWLMPVINKIDSYVNEKLSFSKLDDYRTNWAMIDRPSKYPISRVYEQVIQFIQWYNKENK